MLQLPGTYSFASVAALDQPTTLRIAGDLESAYVSLLQRLAAESVHSIEKEPQVKFKSPFITPRFEFELLGKLAAADTDVVWVRMPTGLFGVRPSHITYSVDKP
jgi:hypothetical protein